MDIPRLFDARLTYSKAAMLLHMLRWKIGDDNFFTALRNYQNNPLLSHSYARNIDLKNELELASSQNLDEFFNDWYLGEGYPSYQLSYDQNNANLISFTLSQSQSHPSVSFFEMPIPVLFKNALHDTTIVFNHTFSGQSFSAQLDFKVDSVIIDPTNWIVCNQNTVTKTHDLSVSNTSLKLFPNPAQEYITLQALGNIESITIYSIDGNIIKSNYVLPSSQNKSLIVDIIDLEAGTYGLNIITKQNIFNTKFVKH